MCILVTGGAGFIGRHTAKVLSESGRNFVVLDNLAAGRRESVRWSPFVEGEIADVALVRTLIRKHGVTAVLHLAASAQVGDSMARPDEYFLNNVCASVGLLKAMMGEGVRRIVFASSCSVYGNPGWARVREDDCVTPLSPYGESKLTLERALPWYERAYGLHWVALRYFNVAGADGDLGEEAEGSGRIIPRAIHAALGGGEPVQIFGTRYPGGDGTAVRDYVHVRDIAHANLLALSYVEAGGHSGAINIGTGTGVSVRQVIDAVGSETGCRPHFHENLARPGDSACVIADASRSSELLGWKPVRSDLAAIVASSVACYQDRAGSKTSAAHSWARG